MSRVLNYTITDKDAGESVVSFLKSRGFSRHLLAQFKRTDGCLSVNDAPPRPGSLLLPGDFLRVTLPPEEPSEHIPPIPLPLAIVYEDEDLIVLDKAPGMPVHPSIGNHENTLANGLAWYYQQQGIPFVFRCINRLDRDTSGLLIVAKHALSGALLSAAMKRREIHRDYLAVVQGVPAAEGIISAPIARAADSVIARCVDVTHGETAITHYECLAVSFDKRYALLHITLETGRTHQIRVHMSHIGHPLPGDFLYCPDYTDYTRQPLHSWQLRFTHPITGQALTFTCPVPQDFHMEYFMKHFPDMRLAD